MRVLLVEDEPELAQLLANGLSEASFAVDVAVHGMDGRRFIEDGTYELIILDVMLPGLNGWQLLQQIRKLGDTPVLFLTTTDGIEDRLRGLELHEDDYLLKPFAVSDLVKRARKLLRRGQGR
ncbi:MULTISPECIES: response regulator [unclassified Pseudomonas]|uniref:Response regulator n=1 Tax=Pseudomonas sp. MYb327 TaxID=2745230 RepID=A0AAU8E1R1_9PSED